MKIRIGFGLGTQSTTTERDRFTVLVDDLERLGFDSLWLSERVNGPALDPIVAMTYAIARTEKLKVGTAVMVLPGRNPVLLAKTLASLDQLSAGRLLPAFGLGIANSAEHQAFGVDRKERAPWFNEALPLMRRLWTEDVVEHHGDRFQLTGCSVNPKPAQKPMDIWMGGAAPAELRRVGRLSDGWLPSFCTPQDVKEGIEIVNQHAADADREIEDEHFGVLLGYTAGDIPDRLLAIAKKRKPDADPTELFAQGRDDLRHRIEAFIEVGASKFVVVPFDEPEDWTEELEALAADLMPLEN